MEILLLQDSGNGFRHNSILSGKKKAEKAFIAKNTEVAYSRGNTNVIAQHNLQCAYTHFHGDGRLPSHVNIMPS